MFIVVGIWRTAICVAGVSPMEWTRSPAVFWVVALWFPSTWYAPRCDWLTVEGVLSDNIALAGDLPLVIEVSNRPCGSKYLFEWIFVFCAGLAVLMAGEVQIDVVVAHFGFIFIHICSAWGKFAPAKNSTRKPLYTKSRERVEVLTYVHPTSPASTFDFQLSTFNLQ